MDEVDGFRSILAARSTVALTGGAFLIAPIVVAIWVSAGRSDRTPQPSVVEPSIDLAGVTPWAAAPAKGYQGPAPTSTPRAFSDDGPACTADDVVATIDGGDGMGGHAATYVGFRNTSTTPCVLKGYPAVVATEPGRPDVRATNGSWFQPSSGTATMRPGESTALVLETDTECGARPGGGGGIPPYHHIAITLPAGGTVQLGGLGHPFDITCGRRRVADLRRHTHEPDRSTDRLGALPVVHGGPATHDQGELPTELRPGEGDRVTWRCPLRDAPVHPRECRARA